MASTPESKVKQKIKKILEKYNAYFFFPSSGAYGRRGIPDIIGCHDGRFFSIEAKATDKDKPTELQKNEMKKIRDHDGMAWIVTGDNVAEFEEEFVWWISYDEFARRRPSYDT